VRHPAPTPLPVPPFRPATPRTTGRNAATVAVAVLVPLAVLAAACGGSPAATGGGGHPRSGTHPAGPQRDAPVAPTTGPTTTIGVSAPGATPPPITGIGATSAAWDAHHTVDPKVPGGSAFGPTVDGQDEYTEVTATNGIVTSFVLTLPSGTSQPAAEQQALAQLPSDAVVTASGPVGPDAVGNTCFYLNATSARLARALAASPVGDTQGVVGIELATNTTGVAAAPYNPGNVNSVTLATEAFLPSNGC